MMMGEESEWTHFFLERDENIGNDNHVFSPSRRKGRESCVSHHLHFSYNRMIIICIRRSYMQMCASVISVVQFKFLLLL